MKKIKLHFGCGNNYLIDYINCDISDNVKTDKKFDLNKFPYPFKDNFADEILMDMVLEHVNNVVDVMEELYRVLKNGGILRIYVPYAKGDWAFQDPTHKNFFTERSMQYFAEGYKYNYYSNVRYRIIKNQLYTSDETFLCKIRNLIPLRALLKYFFFNMYEGIYFEMKAVK